MKKIKFKIGFFQSVIFLIMIGLIVNILDVGVLKGFGELDKVELLVAIGFSIIIGDKDKFFSFGYKKEDKKEEV